MPADELHVRPLTEAQMERFLHVDNIAFMEVPYSDEFKGWARRFLELDRTTGLFDGAEQVGGGSIFSLQLTVPDALRIPVAGVTWVSVLPTHRRRGGLTKLMRHQLEHLHETGGEAVAALTASEPGIYGRFGYGAATFAAAVTVPRQYNRLRLPPGVDEVKLRFVDPKEAQQTTDAIFERQVLKRAGLLNKPQAWSEFEVADLEMMREGRSSLRCVLAERNAVPVGYSHFRTQGGQELRVDVASVYADDAAAYGALWQMLLNIDMSQKTVVQLPMPSDDILLTMLENRRHVTSEVRDAEWIRLVDVDRALAARSYSAQIDAVLEVVDEFCPWNAGRWRLTGDEKGAACTRTDASADLTVNVRDLGAAYLGGPTLRSFAMAGLVTEHTRGAVNAVSRAFSSDVQPWLAHGI